MPNTAPNGDIREHARFQAKVRGEARYLDDLELPDMLHGAILRSPLAHANIVSIDTSKAGTLAGVRAVMTSRDLADLKYVHMPRYSDRRVLARDKVRFYGEEVAAVAAVDAQTARAAVAEIDVRYASLGYAQSPERALKRYFPQINAPPGSALDKNLVLKFNHDYGDVDVSETRASKTIQGQYHAEVVLPPRLEASGTVAHFDAASETLSIWTTSQAPFVVRWELAEVLRLDRDQIHVMPLFVGSPPSASAYCPEHAAIAAALSIATNHPVKIVLRHNEDIMTSRSDCAQRINIRQSLDGEGNALTRGVSVLVDAGAYAGLAPAHLIAGRHLATELYRVPAVRFDWRVAYSNTMAGGLYPSLGIPQMLWAIEDQMDRAAEAYDMDPLDYRVRQANRAGDETPLGRHAQGSEMIACLQAAGDRIGWREKREMRESGRGVGVATCVWPSAGILNAEGFACEVSLALDASGRISLGVERATADARQNSILARSCAQALGIRESLIDLATWNPDGTARQSALAPYDETLVLLDAILDAARAFRTTLGTALLDPHIRIEGDRVVSEAQGALPLADVYAKVGPCISSGVASRSAAQASEAQGHSPEMHSVCAHAADVEVAPLTGEVRVHRVVVALDIGEILWREALETEVREGVMRAIALALGEPMRFDAGKPVNTSASSLGVPRFQDAPVIEIVPVASQSPSGTLNAKATGESTGYASVAAIAGAIAHATGCRLDTLPFTPERIRAAMMHKANVDKAPHEAIPTYALAQATNIRDAALRATLNVVPTRRPMPLAHAEEYRYLLAEHVGEVFDHLLRSGVATKIRAGGTDLTPGIRQGIYRPELVVDISRIAALIGVRRTHNCLRIGACTHLSALEVDAEVQDLFPALADSVNVIASRQVRNLATVGGNLCQQKQCSYYRNAFPCRKLKGIGNPCFAVKGDHRRHSIMRTWPCAAPCPSDLAPLLDVLDAALVIGSASGERRTSMSGFYRWSGEPALAPDEVLTAIEVPLHASPRSTVFEKHAAAHGDFALASVAVSIAIRQGRIRTARISLGGISPFPERARLAERMLVEQTSSDQLIRDAARATVRGALPMPMNKGKVPLVVQLAERALARALGHAV